MNNKEALILLADFENTLVYEDRFFVEHEAIDIIKKKINQLELEVNANTPFFRARIYNEENYLDLNKIYEKWQRLQKEIISTDDKENLINYIQKVNTKRDINLVRQNFWGYQKGHNLRPPKEKIGALDGRGNPPYIRDTLINKAFAFPICKTWG